MSRIQRLLVGLVAVLGLVAATNLATAGQANAVTPTQHHAKATTHVQAVAARHHKPPLSSIQPSYLASSWCGNFWRGPMYCVNFSRSEQKYYSLVNLSVATAAICTASLGIGCIVAGTVAAVMQKYIDNHGICPTSHPVLEVEYAPFPGGYAACSNG